MTCPLNPYPRPIPLCQPDLALGPEQGLARALTLAAALLLVAPLVVAPAAWAAASPSGSPASLDAAELLKEYSKELGLSPVDIREAEVSSVVPGSGSGVTHVYFQQRYQGLQVQGGVFNLSLRGNGQLIHLGNRFVTDIAASANGQNAALDAVAAATAAASHLRLQPTEAFETLSFEGGDEEATTLSDGGIASRPIEARLEWFPTGGGVRLAWKIEIDQLGGQHWWQAFVDAQTGDALGQYDLVVHDPLGGILGAIDREEDLAPGGGPGVRSGPLGSRSQAVFPPTDGAVYNVFPLPFESPTDGPRARVENAADPAASPFGWHDTDGIAGPNFTVTRGNNAHAYTDLDANNVADPGSDPDGGAALDFDFPLDLTQDPSTYRPAVVTNLFYWNNIVHDVTHGFGFDEASGNFQETNYGGLGLGGDYVRAEAQDGSGTNNANFSTPSDGNRPRMQMFIWTHPTPNFVTVNGGPIAGDFTASRAAFGPQLLDIGPVTADVTLADDGVGATSDACEPLVGFPAGDIALVDRGTCAFVLKALNAQAAGAVGVIVANNVAGILTLGGTDPAVLIPSVMVTLDDGNTFKANLPLNATLRPNAALSINRDSDLDAGVIAHEYGHGISNRLTGGPAVVNCLRNAEQMGEGWSDWQALTFTTEPGDTPLTVRGVGTYVIFQPEDGNGIRPTPYSTDLAVNPSTYASVADVANISQPHGIGYVWNTMLWEMHWNLVDRYGLNADIYGDHATGGNNLAMQLVQDGMKFQPCSPGFVDGRDGILTADAALTGGANQCEIWRAFAKRGLGFSADQGDSDDRTDGVERFDLPPACTVAVFGGFDPPVDDAPAVNSVNAGSNVPLKFTLSGAGTSLIIDSQPVDCTTLVPTGEAPQALDTSSLIVKSGDRFHLNWHTDPAWENTCRRVTIRIPAASDAVAYFSFF